MVNLNGDMKDEKNVAEALKGNYGTTRLSNQVECFYQGHFVYFEGFFDGTQNVIEIPKIPKRCIVHFAGEDFSCIAIAEANSGFVHVPDAAKGKKFAIMSNCGLNN